MPLHLESKTKPLPLRTTLLMKEGQREMALISMANPLAMEGIEVARTIKKTILRVQMVTSTVQMEEVQI